MSTVEKRVKSPWDYAAYAAIPEDGKRHEIIDGEHFVNPAPNLYHQEVSRHIQFQLYTQIELTEQGKVINAPVDLQLYENSGIPEYWIVSPDDHQITQLVLQGDRYTESIETTSITMKVAPQATVDLTRVW
jgi:hypothetical protein